MRAPPFYIVDLHHKDGCIIVRRNGESHDDDSVDTSVISRINALAVAFAESPCDIRTSAARDLGDELFRLLDGRTQKLTEQLRVAGERGAELHVVVRLTSDERSEIPRHPALRWHLHLATAAGEPLTQISFITFSVQIGHGEPRHPEYISNNQLKLLFMGYTSPELESYIDHEGESLRIAGELAPSIEARRLIMDTMEEGSLSRLKTQLMSEGRYDIIHLSLQGIVVPDGPRIVTEDATGTPKRVTADELLRVLEAGPAMPRLLMLSIWHLTDAPGRLWEIFGELAQGGVPIVIFWLRSLASGNLTDFNQANLEDMYESMNFASNPVKEILHRLCVGDSPSQALAHAHRRLALVRTPSPTGAFSHTWTRLGMLTAKATGFAITPGQPGSPPSPQPPARFITVRMSTAGNDFVGRHHELRTLHQIINHGKHTPPGADTRICAGAIINGARGRGKSSLVERMLQRNHRNKAPVVIKGILNAQRVLLEFQTVAQRSGDTAAEQVLGNEGRTVMHRLTSLLRHNWRDQKIAVVFDDFDDNLEIRSEGEARLKLFAAELLDVLIPICRDEAPKLFVTTIARFELAQHLRDMMADVPLGKLSSSDICQLWARRKDTDLRHVSIRDWVTLCEELDRNAWMLAKARSCFRGKDPHEVQLLIEQIPRELIKQYQRHVLFKEAEDEMGTDAMVFIDRVRAYKTPTFEAISGLTEGLTLSQGNIVALANLGLLVVDTEDGHTMYRANPLIEWIRDSTKLK